MKLSLDSQNIRSFYDDRFTIKGSMFQLFNSKVYYCPLCNKKQTKAIDQLPRNWTIEAAVQKLEELGPAPVVPAKQFCQIHPNMEVSLGLYQIDTISDLWPPLDGGRISIFERLFQDASNARRQFVSNVFTWSCQKGKKMQQSVVEIVITNLWRNFIKRRKSST